MEFESFIEPLLIMKRNSIADREFFHVVRDGIFTNSINGCRESFAARICGKRTLYRTKSDC